MTGAELKNFVKQVYFHLDVMVSAGEITAEDRIALGPEIIRSRLDKEGLSL